MGARTPCVFCLPKNKNRMLKESNMDWKQDAYQQVSKLTDFLLNDENGSVTKLNIFSITKEKIEIVQISRFKVCYLWQKPERIQRQKTKNKKKMEHGFSLQ